MSTRHWRKSTFSTDNSGVEDCVEVTTLPDGRIGLRDSKHPEAGHLTFTRTEMAAWLQAAQAGEFDDLC